MQKVFKLLWRGTMLTLVTVSSTKLYKTFDKNFTVLYTYIVEQERQFHSNHKPIAETQTDISVNDRSTLMTWLIRICTSNHFESMHLVSSQSLPKLKNILGSTSPLCWNN